MTLILNAGTPKLARQKPQRYEQQLQSAVFQFIRLHERQYPQLAFAFHVPNGGFRSKVEAAIFKRGGVLAGVPDICLPFPGYGMDGQRYAGLYMELKTPGNQLTEAQERFLHFVSTHGYLAVCCNTFEAATKRILAFVQRPYA